MVPTSDKGRHYTKNNVLDSLGTESFRPCKAVQYIQLIAMVELLRNIWPGLLSSLVRNVTSAASSEIIKKSTLQDVELRYMKKTTDKILTAIVGRQITCSCSTPRAPFSSCLASPSRRS
jgi:hypothetical protein